jgi:hypothetical protein
VAVLLPVSACGTSGDSASPNAAPATEITGSVFAAPVNGAAVTVKDANGITIAGPVSTANDGTYRVVIPTSALDSDLRIESNAGTFTDEATGTATTAGTLAAFITGGTLTTGSVHIDPSSTIIHALVTEAARPMAKRTDLNAAWVYARRRWLRKTDVWFRCAQRLAA